MHSRPRPVHTWIDYLRRLGPSTGFSTTAPRTTCQADLFRDDEAGSDSERARHGEYEPYVLVIHHFNLQRSLGV